VDGTQGFVIAVDKERKVELSQEERLELRDVALGQCAADRVLVNGSVVDVFTEAVYPADMAIKGRAIAAVGDVRHTIGPKTEQIDVSGHHACPGLIECHHHIGGSHLSMTEFGKLALARGTTCVATDLYEPGIVRGVRGIRFCLDELRQSGVKPIFLAPLPAYYQNEPFEVLGTFTADEVREVLRWSDCYGINEVVLEKLLDGDDFLIELVTEAQRLGKAVVSHGAGLRGQRLQAALNVAGRTSDHEAVDWPEAEEKARLGMAVLIREGSAASDLEAILSGAVEQGRTPGDFCFSTDEDDPVRMSRLGYLDAKVRMAVELGIPALRAIRAASLNAAVHYRIDHHVGAIAPGRCADLVLTRDLDRFAPDLVFADGRLVGENGDYVGDAAPPAYPEFVSDTVHLDHVLADTFSIPAAGAGRVRVRVIGAREGTLVSEPVVHELVARDGSLDADPAADVLKVAVLDRHQHSGRVAVGFIQGFGLRRGAIASAFNPCTENVVAVGARDADMAAAVNALVDMRGGFVAVDGGAVIEAVEMPLFGLMSAEPVGTVTGKWERLNAAVRSLGCPLRSPFHTLAFMVFPGHFGRWKLCSSGLADVPAQRLVQVIIDDPAD
jgi:adenine deaminase